ncbi:MAG: glycosyltransferase family 9 protein [Nitrospira sp. BO4]|jgi:ADP-heptose:LPS heptosyltransferase|nr:glycosyltransferase family 9 protein [Nitrospira sp. BO4]
MKQVLIVNITRMGDLVQMGALLARLREEWPGVAVDLVVDRQFAPVASMLSGLRDILAYDFHALIDESRACVKDTVALYREVAAWAGNLHERRYDRIINLTFNRPSALLADYVGAPDIRGARSAWDGGTVIDNPWMAYFTDIHQIRRINRFNLVDVYALAGSGPGSFAPLHVTAPAESGDWAQRFLSNPNRPDAKWIAVQAGASDVMKAWRPQHFGETLARFSARWNGGILFVGSASEQETVAHVIRTYREAGGRCSIKNAVGQTTLAQLTALLARCWLLLTNDTGPMHLAVGVQTPVIDLSVGHVDFQETGPYGTGHWVVQPDLECAPCGFDQVCPHHACKDRLPIDSIVEVMRHVVGEGPLPLVAPGYRLYRSGIDEDQLGCFQLVSGREDPVIAWYAAFWRRRWYTSFTGQPSRLPVLNGLPPDTREASACIGAMVPLLDTLCQRADHIVTLIGQAPIPVQAVQSLQRTQAEDRQKVAMAGTATWATKPVTTAALRLLHQDNVQGLEQMARHHAAAYHRWRREIGIVASRLASVSETVNPSPIVPASYAGIR